MNHICKSSLIALIIVNFFISCDLNKHEKPPNVIFILTDDLGYSDLSVYGSDHIRTPHLDQLAADGAKLTSYYATQAVCSASRASILTGTYPNRIGIGGALGPRSKNGINPNELLISEMLKNNGYKTAIFGKWHLGHHDKFLPTRHGFDEFLGILYSNDMWPYHPERPQDYPDLYLYDQEKPIRLLTDQSNLTQEFTKKSIDFINKNKDSPFFLYLAHPQPHVPLFASEKFEGRSKKGLYTDVIEEIDDSVGQITRALKENGLENNTIIIFTSDNGPWLSYGGHAGKTGVYREGKGTTWEGGQRVPCIVWYPKEIENNSIIDTPLMGIDWMPTIARLTKSELSSNKIDGKDIWDVLTSRVSESPHDALFFYYAGNQLQSIRHKDWKMYFPHRYRTLNGRKGRSDGMPIKYESKELDSIELYNLKVDPSETENVFSIYPEIVKKINSIADVKRNELGDDLMNIEGQEIRPPGTID